MRRAFRFTRLLVAACFILAACSYPQTPTPTVPPGDESAFRPRTDTWLDVLGLTDKSDFMAGTSVVDVGDGYYVVAAGFKPGLKNDIGLLLIGSDGLIVSQRYTSNREHIGGLSSDFLGNTLFVKALNLGGNTVSLAFDNVLLPEVGTHKTTVSGWQLALGKSNPRGVAVTDVLKVGNEYILRLAIGQGQEAHLGILRVNSDGQVLGKVEYPVVKVDRAGKLFQTADGFFITAGYIRMADGSERAAVIWLNHFGLFDHSVTVEMVPYQLHPDAPLAHSGGYQDLALLPDGDIILVQNFQICSIQCPGSGALITRLSSQGVEEWTVGLHALGIGGQTFIREIRQEGDQLILVGGSSVYLETGTSDIHLNVLMASLDAATGKPTWIRSLGPKRYSGSSNEFKTDYANALLPTGDGRMIFTGTTDSFGSGQNYNGSTYYQHFDLLVGMAGMEYGGIQGASSIMWSPDLSDEYKVWDVNKEIILSNCNNACLPVPLDVSLTPVEYTAEPLGLTKRDLAAGFRTGTQALDMTVSDYGRYMLNNSTIFMDPDKDPDGDGLNQAWEEAAVRLVEPILEMSKDESWLKNQGRHWVVNFVRVTPYPTKEIPAYVLFEYAVTWSMDYGAIIKSKYLPPPGQITFENHRGDIEKVILAWRLETDRSMRLEWVYTSAHYGTTLHAGVWNAYDKTCNRGNISDTGKQPGQKEPQVVGTELMCETLTFKDNRILLQVSKDKHALYPSIDVCNKVTLLAILGGIVETWGEACGGGKSWLLPVFNVGEPDHHLLNYLDGSDPRFPQRWFPNESVYDGNIKDPDNFCGGLQPPPNNCSNNYVSLALNDELPLILKAKLGPTLYRIRIKTADKLGAGTDSTVIITLYAADGRYIRKMLDGSFERNKVDIFYIGNEGFSDDIGDIVKIGLEKDDRESRPDKHIDLAGYENYKLRTTDWYVQEVQVENKLTGNKVIFEVNMDITDSFVHYYWPKANQ